MPWLGQSFLWNITCSLLCFDDNNDGDYDHDEVERLPVLDPSIPLTSKAFGLSLSVPKMYLQQRMEPSL